MNNSLKLNCPKANWQQIPSSEPLQDFKRSITKPIFIKMALVLIGCSLLPLFVGLLVEHQQDNLLQQQLVANHIEQFISTLKDAETGARGFILTGNVGYLEPFEQATSEVQRDMAQLERDANLLFLPSEPVAKARHLMDAKIATSGEIIELRNKRGLDAAIASLKSGKGLMIMNEIRSLVEDLEHRKKIDIENAQLRLQRLETMRTFTWSFAVVLNLSFLFWAYRRTQKDMKSRDVALDSLNRSLSSLADANRNLAENSELMRLFMEATPLTIAMFDKDMKYLMASKSWKIEYRAGDQEMIGRCHYEIFPNQPARWRDVHNRCLAGATERCEKDRYILDDGTELWLQWEVRPWRKADHEIGGIVIWSQIITDRVRTEQALQTNRQLLI